MEAEAVIKKFLEKGDMKKDLWIREESKPIEKKRKEAKKSILIMVSILLFVAVLSLVMGWFLPDLLIFFIILFIILALIASFIGILTYKYISRLKKDIETYEKDASIATLMTKFKNQETVSYGSLIEISKISEETMQSIAECIRDALLSIEDTYTFKTIMEEEKRFGIPIVLSAFAKLWVIYDVHSPFFVNISVLELQKYGREILFLEIVAINDDKKDLEIHKIKKITRRCVMERVNSRSQSPSPLS